MLIQYTLFGLTLFGFWLPLAFWSAIGTWLLVSPRRRAELSLGAICVLSVAGLLLAVVFPISGGTGLHELGTFTAVPLYFCTVYKKTSLWAVGVTAYLSTLIADVLSAPFMHAGVSFAWAPWNMLTNPPVYGRLFWVGGDGLMDGLLLGPLSATILTFLIRQFVQAYNTERKGKR